MAASRGQRNSAGRGSGGSREQTLQLTAVEKNHDVCYLTMCDRAYPKKLAFQYLEDLRNEFERVNGSLIETAARPYAVPEDEGSSTSIVPSKMFSRR
ncbi:hypothetical protein K1719_016977 [Acacia pycnantha]|nr:hypothetical protein K1719_016977 [Acacia pycnantha]